MDNSLKSLIFVPQNKRRSKAMTVNINPFVVTGKIPAPYFCDRVEEAKVLSMALFNQMNVVITSPRRMGKTSLVDFVFDKEDVQKDYFTISVDILHTTCFKEFIYVLGTAVYEKVASKSDKMRRLFMMTLRSLSASFGYDPIQNTPTFDVKLGDINMPEYTIKEIFEFIEHADKRCLVVIDEFQQITKYPEKNIEAILRSYIQKLSNANFVFAGSQRTILEEMFLSSRRPFFQSAKLIQLEAIVLPIYQEFVIKHFQEGEKNIMPEAIEKVYMTFRGVTLYMQRIMKDAYAMTPVGVTCDMALVDSLIDSFVTENDYRIRELLAYISEPQKEVLYAIHEEGQAKSIVSAAFTKKHRLKSPSATQSAAQKLLEDDILTRNEKVYSIADPLLILWLDKKV